MGKKLTDIDKIIRAFDKYTTKTDKQIAKLEYDLKEERSVREAYEIINNKNIKDLNEKHKIKKAVNKKRFIKLTKDYQALLKLIKLECRQMGYCTLTTNEFRLLLGNMEGILVAPHRIATLINAMVDHKEIRKEKYYTKEGKLGLTRRIFVLRKVNEEKRSR